ncbi:MAG: alpha-hydroxy-acid oxidizing protein [Chloroflexota bacterium]|nr:alpha-hydroxy-acid oxidizing protein [Chloroflexota bacterium]MDE3193507.1 alpha-hydroxy-acid oxidizing protein [Chloroflexota bacterium]
MSDAGLVRHDVLNIADLRRLAKARVPRIVFDYIDGGAEDEVTLGANTRAYEEIAFRPRGATALPEPDLSTTVLGTRLALPFILAPLGSTRLFHARGEVLAARAAGRAGTAYTLSTLAGSTIEDVRADSRGPWWYQLYLVGGRDVARRAIARARAAGYSALLVTIDTAVAGMRERDLRDGVKELLGGSLLEKMRFSPQFLVRPRWLYEFLRDGGLMSFPNVVLADGPMRYIDVGPALEQSVVTWDDIGWIREAWGGPIVVKGVLTAEDARAAIAAGVDAMVVSNHGGRQLDGAPPTIRVLAEVLEEVNGRVEVLVDGGIRRGADVVKALCLGARAVLVGRAYAYGLAAGGEAGVARAIEILRSEIVRTLRLLGCAATRDLDASYVAVPPSWTTSRRAVR